MSVDSHGNLYVGEASTGRRVQRFTAGAAARGDAVESRSGGGRRSSPARTRRVIVPGTGVSPIMRISPVVFAVRAVVLFVTLVGFASTPAAAQNESPLRRLEDEVGRSAARGQHDDVRAFPECGDAHHRGIHERRRDPRGYVTLFDGVFRPVKDARVRRRRWRWWMPVPRASRRGETGRSPGDPQQDLRRRQSHRQRVSQLRSRRGGACVLPPSTSGSAGKLCTSMVPRAQGAYADESRNDDES